MEVNDEYFKWVDDHRGEDANVLRLKYAGKATGFDAESAILQVGCRKKYARKFPRLLGAGSRFVFPTGLSAEQASSEDAADFHASLVDAGGRVCDLTAGLGIDAMALARVSESVTAYERQPLLAEALRHNLEATATENVRVVCGDSREALEAMTAEAEATGQRPFDAMFIDPARRAGDGGRIFALEDCEPDVTALLPQLSKLCRRLVVKASPMLDASSVAVSVAPYVPSRVIALGTSTECKELVVVIDFDRPAAETLTEAVTAGGRASFAYKADEERDCAKPEVCAEVKAGAFLFEPYPAAMKAGGFKLMAAASGLMMLHANTRLFYSESLPELFPGEAFRVKEVMEWSSGNIKRFRRRYERINVTARNFGISAEEVRKKLGVRDGGELRLFAFTDGAGRRVAAVCEIAARY